MNKVLAGGFLLASFLFPFSVKAHYGHHEYTICNQGPKTEYELYGEEYDLWNGDCNTHTLYGYDDLRPQIRYEDDNYAYIYPGFTLHLERTLGNHWHYYTDY